MKEETLKIFILIFKRKANVGINPYEHGVKAGRQVYELPDENTLPVPVTLSQIRPYMCKLRSYYD